MSTKPAPGASCSVYRPVQFIGPRMFTCADHQDRLLLVFIKVGRYRCANQYRVDLSRDREKTLIGFDQIFLFCENPTSEQLYIDNVASWCNTYQAICSVH